MPTIEEQIAECNQWAEWLQAEGYTVTRTWPEGSSALDYFNYVYTVRSPRGRKNQVATFGIDGCGASWAGPDSLWLQVIGKHVGVTA